MDLIIDPALQSPEIKAPDIHGKKFWPRAGAYLIDVFVIYGLNYLANYGFGTMIGIFLALIVPYFGKSFSFVDSDTTCLNYLIGFIQTLGYFALFEWLYGRTFGKIVFGMQVISTDGKTCSPKQAFIRALYRFVDGIFFGLVANSYMKPPVYQRLGDQKASTLVVSSKDPFVKNSPPWWKFFLALVVYMVFEFPIVIFGLLPYLRFA